jgi:hypothetical protein
LPQVFVDVDAGLESLDTPTSGALEFPWRFLAASARCYLLLSWPFMSPVGAPSSSKNVWFSEKSILLRNVFLRRRDMSEKLELVVGRKGEIYTTRRLREKIGLVPGGRALATFDDGRLVIQPKPSALSLLRKARVNAEALKPKELSKLRKELAEELEVR